jgi:hypothetical protein
VTLSKETTTKVRPTLRLWQNLTSTLYNEIIQILFSGLHNGFCAI